MSIREFTNTELFSARASLGKRNKETLRTWTLRESSDWPCIVLYLAEKSRDCSKLKVTPEAFPHPGLALTSTRLLVYDASSPAPF